MSRIRKREVWLRQLTVLFSLTIKISGELTEEQAKNAAKSTISAIHYENNN